MSDAEMFARVWSLVWSTCHRLHVPPGLLPHCDVHQARGAVLSDLDVTVDWVYVALVNGKPVGEVGSVKNSDDGEFVINGEMFPYYADDAVAYLAARMLNAIGEAVEVEGRRLLELAESLSEVSRADL